MSKLYSLLLAAMLLVIVLTNCSNPNRIDIVQNSWISDNTVIHIPQEYVLQDFDREEKDDELIITIRYKVKERH